MVEGRIRTIVRTLALLMSVAVFGQNSTFFTPGNLVVSVEGCGVHAGTCTTVSNGTGNGTGNSSVGGYGDNQGAPLTLFQYTLTGTASVTFVNSLVLPQAASAANLPISGEYGSSSEGSLQLSGAGQYLTIMGYGIDAPTFDATPATYGAAPSNALAQSGSLTGQSYTAVPRVLTLIDANGNVNSSTAIYNIFNTNNPRSAYTLTGSTAYVSGQGSGSDATGGVFYVPVGAPNTAPTAITGLDTSSKTIAQDTRIVQILNNTLYVSVDSKEGSGNNRSFIGALGDPPATSLYNSGGGPTMLTGYGNTGGTGKETITTGSNGNGNNLNAGLPINLSAENYFFASSSVLYVADSGAPKNDSNGDNNSTGTANIGDGGLQKWTNSKADGTGTWSLAYTLYQGLNLVNNGSASGTSGLIGLAGTLSGNNVYLYATNYTLNDLDYTYLYGITDNLTYTTASQASGETFTLLDTAPADSNFKGVSFVPTIPAGDVEVTSSPSGLAFTSSGTGCAPAGYTTPLTLTWTPGSSCTLTVTTPQSGGTGVEYVFSNWENGATSTTRNVTAPTTTSTYSANFTTEYQLTTAAGTGGSVTPGGFFAAGTDATITATPNTGYCFANFTGATTSTSNPLLLLMNGPQSIVANFAHGSGVYSPVVGGTLTGTSATFSWCAVPNATAYWLDIGKEAGGNEYEQSGALSSSTSSLTVNSLPSDGSTVYVTWYYLLSGNWVSTGYTYTAYGAGTAGVITSPTPPGPLTGSSVTFNWSAGAGATAYWIDAGTAPGSGQYFSSGNIGNVLTDTVSNMPTNGSTVYITLFSLVGGNWLNNSYTYTAFNQAASAGMLTTPMPGSTLTSSTVTFDWTAGAGASAYWMDISKVGPGGNDVYQSGNLGNVLTTTVSGLPTDGSELYVTLYSLIGGNWVANAYTYYSLNATGGLAVVTSPTNNSTLSGNQQTFTWSLDSNATAYWMDVSNVSPGGNDLDQSGNLGNVSSYTVYNLPGDGSTVYVTLYSYVGGQWLSAASQYVSGPVKK